MSKDTKHQDGKDSENEQKQNKKSEEKKAIEPSTQTDVNHEKLTSERRSSC